MDAKSKLVSIPQPKKEPSQKVLEFLAWLKEETDSGDLVELAIVGLGADGSIYRHHTSPPSGDLETIIGAMQTMQVELSISSFEQQD